MINLHAHSLTHGMFGHDPHWGPLWERNTLKIGNWYLGNKDPNAPHPAESFSREKHFERIAERGITKLVLSQPAHMYMYWAGAFGTEFARIVNDELSAVW